MFKYVKMKKFPIIKSYSRENDDDCSYTEIEFRQPLTRKHENSVISKLVLNAVIHALDASLTALLSPVIMWQWLSKHDQFMIMLKVIFEVAIELIMLIVFAGVSILTTAALILDDFYDTENYNNDSTKPKSTDENCTKITKTSS